LQKISGRAISYRVEVRRRDKPSWVVFGHPGRSWAVPKVISVRSGMASYAPTAGSAKYFALPLHMEKKWAQAKAHDGTGWKPVPPKNHAELRSLRMTAMGTFAEVASM
jgi:hypothetical protein